MAYSTYKYLPRKTASDKVLHNKTFAIASNTKNDGYQRGLVSLIYNFFWQKIWTDIVWKDQSFANGSHKPIVRKFKERKIYSLSYG